MLCTFTGLSWSSIAALRVLTNCQADCHKIGLKHPQTNQIDHPACQLGSMPAQKEKILRPFSKL